MKKDCFGYSPEAKGCVALNRTYCKKGPCSFYKSIKQLAQEQERADIRLLRLGSAAREELRERYPTVLWEDEA